MTETKRRSYRLSREGRRRLQQAGRRNVRKYRPWQFSTGPRTPAGKATVATNPLRHGRFVKRRVDPELLAAVNRVFNRPELREQLVAAHAAGSPTAGELFDILPPEVRAELDLAFFYGLAIAMLRGDVLALRFYWEYRTATDAKRTQAHATIGGVPPDEYFRMLEEQAERDRNTHDAGQPEPHTASGPPRRSP